ncbi:hypothetical protein AC579_6656 [Pseudocercospora musae]|uniref:Uncharacterized protein n=1 Tax=Pseudocercospora musae TaxID=113226 RepID=A0A139IP97_9PEZI|nr:hypothetical protein AC579_6656 [Pseudocercospora musae]
MLVFNTVEMQFKSTFIFALIGSAFAFPTPCNQIDERRSAIAIAEPEPELKACPLWRRVRGNGCKPLETTSTYKREAEAEAEAEAEPKVCPLWKRAFLPNGCKPIGVEKRDAEAEAKVCPLWRRVLDNGCKPAGTTYTSTSASKRDAEAEAKVCPLWKRALPGGCKPIGSYTEKREAKVCPLWKRVTSGCSQPTEKREAEAEPQTEYCALW